MPLSISNSEIDVDIMQTSLTEKSIEPRSIWRPFAVALIALLLYQSIIWMGIFKPSTGGSEAERNRVTIEKYIYGSRKYDIVLTGSSYTQTLDSGAFHSSAFNFGLGGHSSATGVEIITKHPNKPRILLIEISDTIALKTDHSLIDSMLSPVNYHLHKQFSAFRDSYKPMNIVIDYLRRTGSSKQKNNRFIEIKINDKYKEAMIKRKIKDNAKPLSDVYVNYIYDEVKTLKQEICQLREESVRVILYQPPRSKEVEGTYQYQQINSILHRSFPHDSYEWMPAADGDWDTLDGSHLTAKAAATYVQFIENYLKQSKR